MSLPTIQNIGRIVTASVCRRHSSLPSGRFRSKSPVLHTFRRCASNIPKNPNSNEAPTKQSKAPQKTKDPAPVIEKGDKYIAGETYYSFNPYSFYDIENEMKPSRQPQPNSGMKTFCSEKLTPPEKDVTRHLLPEKSGYLVEWPRKKEPKTKYKPMRPVMEKKYGMKHETKDPLNRYRIPF